MRITLNLATRPYADLRPALKRLRIAMAVLAVMAVGLGLGLRAFHQQAEQARATEQNVQRKIDAITRERQGYQDMMNEPANARLLEEVAELNQIFDEKTFSWTLAMEDLETVLPAGVQVTAIDPTRDTKTGKITMKLRIAGPRDKGDDLVQNLEHSRYFVAPHIVSESTESNGGPNERLEPVSATNRYTFELLADYNTDVLLEHRAHRKTERADASAEGAKQGDSHPAKHPAGTPGVGGPPGPVRSPAVMPPGRIPPNGNPLFNRNPNQIPNRNPTSVPNQGGPR